MGILLGRHARAAALITTALVLGPAVATASSVAAEPRDVAVSAAPGVAPGDICGPGGTGPALTPTDTDLHINGTLAVDEDLEADTPTWNPPAFCVEYAWYHNGVLNELSEFPGPHHLGPDSLGATVKVVITGYQSVYTPSSVVITAPQPVAGNTFTVTKPIGLVGNPRVGATLRGKGGAVTPAATVTRYWLRDGRRIVGASDTSYSPVASDLGHQIAYAVLAQRPGYAASLQTSQAVQIGRGRLKPGAQPSISGVARVGRILTASPGTWRPSPTTTSYQWVRSGAAIRGAHGSTYRCRVADRNHGIRVRVTVSRAGYGTRTRISDQVTCR